MILIREVSATERKRLLCAPCLSGIITCLKKVTEGVGLRTIAFKNHSVKGSRMIAIDHARPIGIITDWILHPSDAAIITMKLAVVIGGLPQPIFIIGTESITR